jgi:hypothetical protein
MDSNLGPLFCSIGLHVCFLCQYHAVSVAMALEYSLKLGIMIPPAFLFLNSIALAIPILL